MEVTINSKSYTSSKTESGHEVLTSTTGRECAQCLFCGKVKGVAVMGATYNTLHLPFTFPVYICHACTKQTGWGDGVNGTCLGGNHRCV